MQHGYRELVRRCLKRFVLLYCFGIVRILGESGPLVRIGDEWLYWKGTNEPAGSVLEWTGVNYRRKDTWARSPSGFGSVGPNVGSRIDIPELEPLSDHPDRYVAGYFRREFSVVNRASIRWLTLRLDYQEGFVVYVNGREQLRVNLPGPPGQAVPVGTLAQRRDATGAVEFDLSMAIPWLRDGINVLAIQVHTDHPPGALSVEPFGGDLLCVPELLANFTRGPWVQDLRKDSVVVTIGTPKPTRVTVDYGVTPMFGLTRESWEEAESHEIQLTGLQPGTRYFYRVRVLAEGREVISTTNAVRTFKASGDVQFSVVGGTGSGKLAQHQIAQQLASTPADLVLHCGDLMQPHYAHGRLDARCLSVFGSQMRSVPFYFSAGSLDVAESGVVDFLSTMVLPTNGVDAATQWPTERTEPESYYSFDHGDVHFVCLYNPGNSMWEFGTNSLQYQWLEQDLAQTTKPWKILFQNESIRSSARPRDTRATTNSPPQQQSREGPSALLALAARHGVALILGGQDRCYERFGPIDGVHVVSTGGGGMPLDELHEMDSRSSLFLSAHHFLNLQLRGDAMTVRALGVGGAILDEWEIRRKPPVPRVYPALWSSPWMEMDPADDEDGNVIGQMWDARWELREPEVYAVPATTGIFSNLGRLRCAWDRTNLYFGVDRLMLPPGVEAALFLEVPNQAGVGALNGLGNARLDPGEEGVDGLDALWPMRFENFNPSIVMLFGDEFADGTQRDFLRDGATTASGEGLYWLRPGFPEVVGSRLQQFNRAAQTSAVHGEQNANYVEASIPASALGGLNSGQSIRVGVVGVGPIHQQGPLGRDLDWGFIGTKLDGIETGAWVLTGVEIRLPEDEDLDRDGLSELEEKSVGTNPALADSDGDGLLDGWEYVHRLRGTSASGASGAYGDPDGDFLVNLDEQKLGTNPRRKNSLRLEARTTESGEVELSWPALSVGEVWLESSSTPDGRYRIQGRFVGTTNLLNQTVRLPSGDGMNFFRLRIPAPGAVAPAATGTSGE